MPRIPLLHLQEVLRRSADRTARPARARALDPACHLGVVAVQRADDAPARPLPRSRRTGGRPGRPAAPDTRLASSISSRCPARPKPVTSVQAVTPASRKISAAGPLDSEHRGEQRPEPVRPAVAAHPRRQEGPAAQRLGQDQPSPGRRWLFWNSRPSSPKPVTAKPRASSLPSVVWPPVRTTPSWRKDSHRAGEQFVKLGFLDRARGRRAAWRWPAPRRAGRSWRTGR